MSLGATNLLSDTGELCLPLGRGVMFGGVGISVHPSNPSSNSPDPEPLDRRLDKRMGLSGVTLAEEI